MVVVMVDFVVVSIKVGCVSFGCCRSCCSGGVVVVTVSAVGMALSIETKPQRVRAAVMGAGLERERFFFNIRGRGM